MPSLLTIPSNDIYTIRGIEGTRFFKYTNNGCTYRDINVDLSKAHRPTLEGLAKLQGISQPYKLKKAVLLASVQEFIHFE